MTRKQALLAGAGSAFALAGLAGCGSSDDTATATSTGGGAAPDGPKRKVIWALAAIAPWNVPIDVGFYDAAEMVGWEYQKVGLPIAQYSPENVVNVIERAITAKPDVLVTPCWVPGVVDASKKAQDQGILVMWNNANNSPEDAEELGIPYYGQIEYDGGRNMGTRLHQELVRAGKKDGAIAIGIGYPGIGNITARMRGATDAIRELNASEGTSFTTSDFIDGSARSTENVVTAYKAKVRQQGDDLVALLTPQGDASYPAVDAVRQSGKEPGEVLIGSWDTSSRIFDAIGAGWIMGTVDQQDYAEGFVPVMTAWQQLERGYQAHGYDTGGVVIDKASLDAVIERQKTIDASAKKYDISA